MKKIMVVDDEYDVQITLKTLLNNLNYHVEIANDGDDCLKKLEEHPQKPDLIILDIMMPGTPVAEVIEKIDDIKIIFLSAVQISEKNRKKLSANKNVVDFIQKPFDNDDLIKIVKEQVGE